MRNWETIFSGGFCTGVVNVGRPYERICNSILPDTDEGYEIKRDWIVRNMNLIAAAPMMLETLKEIAKAEGAYAEDRITHATNTVKNMQELAQKAINQVEPF